MKIREKGRVEPPHVRVMHKVDEWRLGLRDRQLLVPPGGRIKDIDPAVMRMIDDNWQRLIEAWDVKYPQNPSRESTMRMKKTRMKPTADATKRIVLLGSTAKGLGLGVLPPSVWVCHHRSDLDSAITDFTKRMTWVSFTRSSTELLLERAINARGDLRGSRLVTLTPPRPECVPALLGLFHAVFGLGESSRWLPTSELVEAITTDDASERFIGGSVDRRAKTLTLVRGDITAIVVPFRLFPISGDGTAPDFANVRLTDFGRTVALGDYEAAADSVLYELDPDYRRRLNRQRRDGERTFGAALLRLRKQQRLKRTDFAPISSREIARIERNEVARPHTKTLDILANRLGVRPDEIRTY